MFRLGFPSAILAVKWLDQCDNAPAYPVQVESAIHVTVKVAGRAPVYDILWMLPSDLEINPGVERNRLWHAKAISSADFLSHAIDEDWPCFSGYPLHYHTKLGAVRAPPPEDMR